MKTQTHRAEFLSAVVALLFQVAVAQAQSVYVTTSANLVGTSIFGSLDLTTGMFTQIAPTNELFLGLTTGAGGTIYGADGASQHLYTISPTGVTTQFGTSVAPNNFFGLAYSSAGNFFANNNIPHGNMDLYSISGDGNSETFKGTMATAPKSFGSGGLAFGPAGSLYFNYMTPSINSNQPTLYTVNTSNGALTAVGSGLGPLVNSDLLTLFSVGNTLYGIDTIAMSNIGIYTINTTTGLATPTGVDVTGLPSGYTLDTATFVSTPDTSSTFGLLSLALAALVGASRLRFIQFA